MTRWLLIGSASIVAFDTVASFAAETMEFEYGNVWPLAILMTTGFGFLASRETGSVRAGIVTGMGVALADSTLGWGISWAIGPGAPDQDSRSAISVAAIIVVVTAAGSVEGAVGGWLGKRVASRTAEQR